MYKPKNKTCAYLAIVLFSTLKRSNIVDIMNTYIYFQRSCIRTILYVLLILPEVFIGLSAADGTQNPFIEDRSGTTVLPNLDTILNPQEPPALIQDSSSTNGPDAFLYTFPKNLEPAPVIETTKTILDAASPLIANNRKKINQETVLINFDNVNIIEFIRFVSRLSNRNFVFDENDLQFNVTIVSEEPATIENIMTALLQELRIHDLSLIEDGNNFIIHKNSKLNSISTVVSRSLPESQETNANIVTQVFLLNSLDPEKAANLLRPLTSEKAIVEAVPGSNYLIITDLVSNVDRISQLIKSIDAPNSGVVIGKFQSRETPIDSLIPLVQQIMQPISQNQVLVLVPHSANNSVFIISSPFLVERTIAMFKHIEEENVKTGILDLRSTTSYDNNGEEVVPSLIRAPNGDWNKDVSNSWVFTPSSQFGSSRFIPPPGHWERSNNGSWEFIPGENIPGQVTPEGEWKADNNGRWGFKLASNENFTPTLLVRKPENNPIVTPGVQKTAKFFIQKLKYRKGDSIEPLLRQIADTIQQNERGNEDLISALRSVQWLNVPNSLVFSGTVESLDRVRSLVEEMDTPMRQVFIEMLILETSLTDNLNYGVSYGSRFGGGDVSGSQGFLQAMPPGGNPLRAALNSAGFPAASAATALIPDATHFFNRDGFNLGVVGEKITHCGTEFGSIGALVHALHNRSKDKIISHPKLLIEDGGQAELFVGENTPYRTQSIANDNGNTVTSNFEYRDVGTLLKVTPYIGNGNTISLAIQEEVSVIISGQITQGRTANESPGPTTLINRTVTRVHIPDQYFLIISGMMHNQELEARDQVPCLGGVPLIGGLFSNKTNADRRRNLMIFIRPRIIDTEEEIQRVTKQQQDIYDYNNCLKDSDEYETSELLDLFNLNQTLHPEDVQYDEDKLN